MNIITLVCSQCNENFELPLKQYNSKRKRNPNQTKFFCCVNCFKTFNKENSLKRLISVNCIRCNIEFLKNIKEIKSSPNHFCTKRCAAIFNNKKYPKRTTNKKCIVCQEPVSTYKRERCDKHYEEYKNKQQTSKSKTLGEIKNKILLKGQHPSYLNSYIGNSCRYWNKYLLDLPCANCNYSKHVELCHIKSISSFSNEITLEEINSSDNIIQLCPNCHWELDHGNLKDTLFK